MAGRVKGEEDYIVRSYLVTKELDDFLREHAFEQGYASKSALVREIIELFMGSNG
jgi:hypothetical protein